MMAEGRRYTRNPNKPHNYPGSGKRVYKYGRLVDPSVPISPEVLFGPPKRTQNTRDPRYPKRHDADAYVIDVTPAPPQDSVKTAGDWTSFMIWAIFGGAAAVISIVLLIVILYVFGELTGESPVHRGYFG